MQQTVLSVLRATGHAENASEPSSAVGGDVCDGGVWLRPGARGFGDANGPPRADTGAMRTHAARYGLGPIGRSAIKFLGRPGGLARADSFARVRLRRGHRRT